MRLHTKTLLLTLGPILVLFAILYWSAQSIVLYSFERLEHRQAHLNLYRVLEVIHHEETDLRRLVADWAIWNDSYEFVHNQNQKFIRTNFVIQSFRNLDLNFIAYADSTGRLICAQMRCEPADSLETACICLTEPLRSNPKLSVEVLRDTVFSGLIMTDDGPMLFASHAVYHSDFSGPPVGVLCFGRLLGDVEFTRYSEMVHIVTRAFQPQGQDNPYDVRIAEPKLAGADPWFFQSYDREAAAAYYLLRDYLGQPALILRINFPREIMAEALKTARIFFYMLLAVGLLFTLLLIVLLQRGVVSRLTGLNRSAAQIADAGDLAMRVPVLGHDEVADLARQINAMLTTIEAASQEQNKHAEHLERLFEEVKLSENKLRNIFDFSPDGIAIANLDGVFQECNQAAWKVLGFSERNEFIGRSLIDLIAPKERARVLLILRDIAKQGSLKNFETLCVRKNGKIFESEICLGVVKNADDQPACLVSILRDISERKKAEQVLTMSEQRYRLLFERSLAGVYRTSLDGRILEVNDSMKSILGFTNKEEMMQCRVQDFYEEDGERERFLSTLWEKGSVSNYQHELLRADGSKAWVLENATMLIGESEEPLIIQGTIIDISELKAAEDEIHKSETRYRKWMSDHPIGIFRFSFDPRTSELRQLDCNDAQARILGYASREELMEVDSRAHLHVTPGWDDMLHLLNENKSRFQQELRLKRKDGTTLWALVNVIRVAGARGELDLIEGTMVDISEWKRHGEQDLARAIKAAEDHLRAAMDLTVAGLVHNLNGPLQGIMNSIELLQLTHGDMPHLNEALQQTQRMHAMIVGILNKTRQEQDTNAQEIDLNDLLIQELDYYNADLTFKHDIEKDYHFDSNVQPLRGVYCEFSQAFMNIIKNAVDAMHGREIKRLQVTTQAQADGGVVVEISDSGSGISRDHLERIFDPFFTTKPLAGRQNNGEPTGTGLGLSSVREILEKYQASIQVNSMVGVGTTFRIHIPQQQNGNVNYNFTNEIKSIDELH